MITTVATADKNWSVSDHEETVANTIRITHDAIGETHDTSCQTNVLEDH